MANSGRNFSLTGHHQRFVDEQVEKRRHSSGSEAPREALREFIGGVGKRASRRRTARNGASLRAVLFTGPAERQLDEVLEDSEERFGAAARERYEALFAQALDDLLDNPGRPGVRELDGRVHYHLRHSRKPVPKKSDRANGPRHLVVDDTLVVLAVVAA